jgi:hypothetical protein
MHLWYQERHLLSEANVVFTRSYAKRSSSLYGGTTYSFLDQEGQYRGGENREAQSQWKHGEWLLVFYDRRNPDRNRANFGLRFHELQWME